MICGRCPHDEDEHVMLDIFHYNCRKCDCLQFSYLTMLEETGVVTRVIERTKAAAEEGNTDVN